MKVLVPLPFDLSNMAHGRNLRIVHLLRELNGRCELVCVAPDEQIAEAAGGVLPDVRMVIADGGHAQVRIAGPYRLGRAIAFLGYHQPLLPEIARRAPEVDAVLGFDLPSVVYLLAANGRLGSRPLRSEAAIPSGPAPVRPRTVCDLIDDPRLLRQSFPLSQRWSPAGIKAAISIGVIRKQALGTLDALTAVAPRDADSLARATGLEVTVIPNGVELTENSTDSGQRELLVVFTGAMDFPPNETAACYLVRHVWPRVRRRFDDSPKLAIVGANPTSKVKRLARRPGVIVTGRVDDVSSWLTRARVAVAPMISGCGVKNKVLEACAAGCPVVSTPSGAAGLPTGKGSGIVVADTPQRIADEVAKLLVNVSAARALGAAGRAMVRERFSWSRSARTLLAVLRGRARTIPSEMTGGEPVEPEPLHPRRTADRGQPDDEEALAYAAS